VLAEFATLREAVRAAGLEPNPKGEKISSEDLLEDWKRVAEKLGRRPSRAEYVREGKYSAGAFMARFGSWSGVSTAKKKPVSRELTRRTRINQEPGRANHKGHEETEREKRSGDLVIGTSDDRQPSATIRVPRRLTKPEEWKKEETQRVLHNFDRVPLAAVPAPLMGKRKVTELVAQMVVNTLMGSGYWPLVVGQRQNPFTTEDAEEHGGRTSGDLVIGTLGDHPATQKLRAPGTLGDRPGLRGIDKELDLDTSLAVNAPRVQDDDLLRRDLARRGIKKDRPVMGEPFDRSPMTNAPVNELGVMVLFGMVAARLGLQVESVQGKFPDCQAKRQVAPGKWQHLRIEFEYESKNFLLHGHDPKGCDMIVCWRHNWKECPAEIEVVELSRLIGME
jgi:hypothetical protein